MALITKHFDLDNEDVSLGEVMDFIKKNNIKTNLDKNTADGFAKNDTDSSSSSQNETTGDPKEEKIDL